MKRRVILVLLALTLALVGCKRARTSGSDGDVVIHVASDDAEMNAAIAEAQRTLPDLIAALQHPKEGQSYFGIKAAFPYGEIGEREHMWLSELSYDDQGFHGVLGNDPEFVEGLRHGDQVNVPVEAVTDWMIVEENRVIGAYTVRVLRGRMSPEERADLDRMTGLIFED